MNLRRANHSASLIESYLNWLKPKAHDVQTRTIGFLSLRISFLPIPLLKQHCMQIDHAAWRSHWQPALKVVPLQWLHWHHFQSLKIPLTASSESGVNAIIAMAGLSCHILHSAEFHQCCHCHENNGIKQAKCSVLTMSPLTMTFLIETLVVGSVGGWWMILQGGHKWGEAGFCVIWCPCEKRVLLVNE